MDLLFKRYASPFLFIDGMIQTGRFTEFVVEFVRTNNEEKEEEINWSLYLHKYYGNYSDFMAEVETSKQLQETSPQSIESNVNTAMDILNNFNPKERGET